MARQLALLVTFGAILVLAACARTLSPAPSESADASPSLAQSPAESADASPSPPHPSGALSVICEAFAEGGPMFDLSDALGAALSGQNPAGPTQEGIDGLNSLAQRASGEEQEDLIALASAVEDAAAAGAGTLGWNDAYQAFYTKYAEQCGQGVPT